MVYEKMQSSKKDKTQKEKEKEKCMEEIRQFLMFQMINYQINRKNNKTNSII